jgi:vesicle-associated membrane protein 4
MSPRAQMTEVNQNNSRTEEVQQQVNEVIGIMNTNIEKVVQRGEKLNSLQSKTEELQQGALSFKKTSNDVKNHLYVKKLM